MSKMEDMLLAVDNEMSRPPSYVLTPVMTMAALMSMAAMGSELGGGPMPSLGHARGDNRKRYVAAPDNDPERCLARGLKPFDIDGVIVYAGSLKAAHKKARLLAISAPSSH